ncbi:pantoate--beta-alanine ligase [Nitrospirota bacterium]
MEIIRIPRIMQETVKAQRLRGRDVGLVPTMGALHEGHMSLVRNSMSENPYTVVSIFVNPTQFAPGEDLESYPRDIDGDIARLRAAGVDCLFMPDAGAMYPEGSSASIRMGELAGRLCGAFRPGHFGGVATVVAKLMNITLSTRAYFGLKDYQQYLVVKRLVSDLNMPVEVVGCATLREPDGLAMSSRNAYLDHRGEREAAAVLYRALSEGASMLRQGGRQLPEVEKEMKEITGKEPLVTEVQYLGAYDLGTLEPLAEFSGKALLAGALKLGRTRLIDNVLVE